MPTYPTLPQSYGSRAEVLDGRIAVRATNGAPKGREMYAAEKKVFLVVHEITAAQRSTLLSFYNSYKDVTFDFAFAADGSTYTCIFGAPWRREALVFYGLWRVEVSLLEA